MVYQEKLPKNIKSLFANLTESLDVSYPLAHFWPEDLHYYLNLMLYVDAVQPNIN